MNIKVSLLLFCLSYGTETVVKKNGLKKTAYSLQCEFQVSHMFYNEKISKSCFDVLEWSLAA